MQGERGTNDPDTRGMTAAELVPMGSDLSPLTNKSSFYEVKRLIN